MRLLPSLITLLLLSTAVVAQDAPLSAINHQIDQANFLLGSGAAGQGQQDFCSATLISLTEKLVLTNNHCVVDAISQVTKDVTEDDGSVKSKTIEVWHDMTLRQKSYANFKPVGDTTLQAEIVAHAEKYDLAILKIKADTIPQTIWAQVGDTNTQVQRGDKVYVVGNPYLLDANLTQGIISSTTRNITWTDGTDVPYYGVDAAVNPGNSGGALLNASGIFIGVPGASMRGATGLGFAIPLVTVQQFLKENCYEAVYNSSAPDHKFCEATKLAQLNAARDKRGLPPLNELPVTHARASGKAVLEDKTGLLPSTQLFGPVYQR